MKDQLKFVIRGSLAGNREKVNYLAQLLEKSGIEVSLSESTDERQQLLFSWQEEDLKRIRTRNAGACRKQLREALPLVSEIECRIKESNAQCVARELGISRRTLFYRLKEAKEEGRSSLY